MKSVNKNREPEEKPKESGAGRVAQRNRTRRAIVEAAMRLQAGGGTPSMAEVADAAQVSRRTVYMYFPTLEQLLIDATLGALTLNTVEPVVADPGSNDAVERAVQLSRAVNAHLAETMHLGRALIRLTVEGDAPPPGVPRRGYRRIQWIEQALSPARKALTPAEFERLVSAVTVLIGWEPMIVLEDLRSLDQKHAADVLTFAVRAVVEKALEDAKRRRKEHGGPKSRRS